MADSKNSGDGASRSKIDKMSSEVGIETPIKNRYNLNHHFRLLTQIPTPDLWHFKGWESLQNTKEFVKSL